MLSSHGGAKMSGGPKGDSSRRIRKQSTTLKNRLAGAKANGDAPKNDDQCDITFEVDLEAVNAARLRTLSIGDTLDVLRRAGSPYEAAICVTRPSGAAIGALSAFEGLALLLACMRRGNKYDGVITRLDQISCRVRVVRSAPG